jgi:molybdate transport system substrate-binding protein
VPVGKIGVGVAIPRSGRRPDLSSADTLKASILQADAVVFTLGASGVFVEKMLADMGVADLVRAKVVRVPTGAAVMTRLGAARTNEIGFTMISDWFGESPRRARRPLPAAIQTMTAYDAVVMSSAGRLTPRAFVRAIVSPPAKQLPTAAGWSF